jgi:hypothetical protein
MGWGVQPSVEDATAGDGHGDDDGPTYDLGWGQPVDTPTVGDITPAAETDGKPGYLCSIHILTLLISRDRSHK